MGAPRGGGSRGVRLGEGGWNGEFGIWIWVCVVGVVKGGVKCRYWPSQRPMGVKRGVGEGRGGAASFMLFACSIASQQQEF